MVIKKWAVVLWFLQNFNLLVGSGMQSDAVAVGTQLRFDDHETYEKGDEGRNEDRGQKILKGLAIAALLVISGGLLYWLNSRSTSKSLDDKTKGQAESSVPPAPASASASTSPQPSGLKPSSLQPSKPASTPVRAPSSTLVPSSSSAPRPSTTPAPSPARAPLPKSVPSSSPDPRPSPSKPASTPVRASSPTPVLSSSPAPRPSPSPSIPSSIPAPSPVRAPTTPSSSAPAPIVTSPPTTELHPESRSQRQLSSRQSASPKSETPPPVTQSNKVIYAGLPSVIRNDGSDEIDASEATPHSFQNSHFKGAVISHRGRAPQRRTNEDGEFVALEGGDGDSGLGFGGVFDGHGGWGAAAFIVKWLQDNYSNLIFKKCRKKDWKEFGQYLEGLTTLIDKDFLDEYKARLKVIDAFIGESFEKYYDNFLEKSPRAKQLSDEDIFNIIKETNYFREIDEGNKEAIIREINKAYEKAQESRRISRSVTNDDLKKEIEELVRNIVRYHSGSTFTGAFFKKTPGKNTAKGYLVNLGDSRIGVFDKNGTAKYTTEDHKPTNPDELARITQAGGFVADERVLGSLAVSRAIGDFRYKIDTPNYDPKKACFTANLVSSHAEVSQFEVEKGGFVIIGCDGLWDEFTVQAAGEFVASRIKKGMKLDVIVKELFMESLRSNDNVTIMIIQLK